MRRPGLLAAALALIVPVSASAGGGRQWKVDTAKELAAGEGVGIRFDAEGGISPGPERVELARVEETLLLSVLVKGPEVYAGTGFSGNVHRLVGGKLTKLETAAGTGVFALASSGGDVYAATTPGGKVWRLGAKPELVGETGLANVWAMATESDGSLLVAGGSPGKLLRLRPKSGGKAAPETLVDSKESDVRSVTVADDGTIWCGTDGHGLVYRLRRGAKPEVMMDAARNEVVALLPGQNGSMLIASTSGETVTNRPLPATATPADKTPSGSVSVTVETSLTSVTASSGGRAGFDLQYLRADGVVESLASREDELAYALAPAENGKALLATGPRGRIYELDDRNLSILREIPEKTAVAIAATGTGAYIVGGAEGGALHRIGPARDPKAVYTSQIHAEDRRSLWGAYSVQASRETKGKLEFRSGNAPTPDETWSEFREAALPEGTVPAPPGRFVQWRISFTGEGFVRSVAVNAVAGNLPPYIESVNVLEPGVLFFRGSFGSGTPVIEAANPEEHGMFTTVGEAKERPELGKRIFRRGYRTITWKATDANDDPLLADVRVRRVDEAGRPLGDWIPTVSDLTEPIWSFDSSALPDGWWQFGVRVSDRKGNAPNDAREHEKVSLPVAIDSAPPEIRSTATKNGAVIEVRATVADALSPLLRAEYAVDGSEWVQLRSVDGVVDQRKEELVFALAKSDGSAPHVVVLRVLDTSYNVATHVVWPEEKR